ncbi:receptor protein kinase-like protein ZAR1 isoform X2 [Rosa rugosa]|uniref:receptor protein kinase-like protein ZAR1 isoform X2 n=1 Tax=Rosa rugosa TaxID=74645 RepID=UPI002B415F1E|nr:receptor protein kinase-like protein ZAR1 isoform X2 [Rosa rugosa]
MLNFLQLALLLVLPAVVLGLNSDGLSLLALKAAIETDPSRVLDSWSDSDSTPCHWHGVVCTRDRVTEVFLTQKGFNGYIPSELGRLDSLKRLNLARNNFSKPIPAHLFNATSLIALDLSRNSLSGPVPAQIGFLKDLRHLDLSSNLLNGSLPESLTELESLAGTLNLSYNQFSGGVPASYGRLPVLVSLDFRHNNLTGKLPQVGSLVNQGPTAFSGNPSLCGFPLEVPCPEAQNPSGSGAQEAQKPLDPNPNLLNGDEGRAKQRGGSVTVPIISGVSLVIGAVSVSVWLLRKKRTAARVGKMGKEGVEKEAVAADEEEGQKGKFVVMDEGFGLELEDLLRASAYVVGKSRSGIVYRVVAGNVGKVVSGAAAAPSVVAVRRLSEGDATWRLKEFESEVEAIGKVVHPNIVRLRAYYYADDEKLLISDFIRNGSLYTALHGYEMTTSTCKHNRSFSLCSCHLQ